MAKDIVNVFTSIWHLGHLPYSWAIHLTHMPDMIHVASHTTIPSHLWYLGHQLWHLGQMYEFWAFDQKNLCDESCSRPICRMSSHHIHVCAGHNILYSRTYPCLGSNMSCQGHSCMTRGPPMYDSRATHVWLEGHPCMTPWPPTHGNKDCASSNLTRQH